MNAKRHTEFLACRDYILKALTNEMLNRDAHDYDVWVANEHMAVARAANEWAISHAPLRTVTVTAVEAVEGMALGHIDYATKFALYVAELVYTNRLVNE